MPSTSVPSNTTRASSQSLHAINTRPTNLLTGVPSPPDPVISVAVEELVVGKRLPYELRDESGQVLCRAGDLVSQALIDQLRRRNSQLKSIESDLEREAANRAIIEACPASMVETISDAIRETQNALLTTVESIRKNTQFRFSVVARNIGNIVSQTSKDVATTLAIVMMKSRTIDPVITNRIANHAIQLSAISVAISLLRGNDSKTTCDIGMAALLHDCALLISPDWFSMPAKDRTEMKRQKFRHHPLESEALLRGFPGISQDVLILIRQVHEQIDGSGYPLGLKEGEQHPGAPILNLVDAYVSLTAPVIGRPFLPADAVAYLCFQASNGYFSKTILKAFVDQVSMYPLGSIVELEDQSKGVVVRNNPSRPLDPVVRIIRNENPTTDIAVPRPAIVNAITTQGDSSSKRIRKTQLDSILWRIDLLCK